MAYPRHDAAGDQDACGEQHASAGDHRCDDAPGGHARGLRTLRMNVARATGDLLAQFAHVLLGLVESIHEDAHPRLRGGAVRQRQGNDGFGLRDVVVQHRAHFVQRLPGRRIEGQVFQFLQRAFELASVFFEVLAHGGRIGARFPLQERGIHVGAQGIVRHVSLHVELESRAVVEDLPGGIGQRMARCIPGGPHCKHEGDADTAEGQQLAGDGQSKVHPLACKQR